MKGVPASKKVGNLCTKGIKLKEPINQNFFATKLLVLSRTDFYTILKNISITAHCSASDIAIKRPITAISHITIRIILSCSRLRDLFSHFSFAHIPPKSRVDYCALEK